MHVEDVDIDEVQCILANLIYMVRESFLLSADLWCGADVIRRPSICGRFLMELFSQEILFKGPPRGLCEREV